MEQSCPGRQSVDTDDATHADEPPEIRGQPGALPLRAVSEPAGSPPLGHTNRLEANKLRLEFRITVFEKHSDYFMQVLL